MRWIATYDISNDGRRVKAANALSTHGERIQRSVYLVDGTPARLNALIRQLGNLIDDTHDSVHAVPLCVTCQNAMITLGSAYIPVGDPFWIT